MTPSVMNVDPIKAPENMKKMSKRSRLALFLVLLPALAVSACGNDSTTSPTTTRTSPVTETFTSNLVVSGAAVRLVAAAQSGTLTATLTTSDQPNTTVGLAIGLRNGTGSGCFVTRDVITTAGATPQLSAPVDAGNYCIKVFDVGQLQRPMNFTVTITYP